MFSPCAAAVSGRRYSIMRSTAPRLPDERREDVPFGAYNTDRGAKCTMEVHSRGERQGTEWGAGRHVHGGRGRAGSRDH